MLDVFELDVDAEFGSIRGAGGCAGKADSGA